MFEWKVEDMALMNEHCNTFIGREKIYRCEHQLSQEEKIAFVDQMQDRKLSYIMDLANRFNNDKDYLPKDQFGCVKTVSLKSWIIRNDTRKLISYFNDYGRIFLINKIHRSIENINRKGNYDTYEDFVDEVFHCQLKECEAAEKKYFREHDEYSILKDQLRATKHNTTFGVSIGYSSDGEVYVYDDEGKYSREITIDELKILLSKYEQLDRYIEKLSAEVDIKY